MDNREQVRKLLAEKQPEFTCVLETALEDLCPGHCPECGAVIREKWSGVECTSCA